MILWWHNGNNPAIWDSITISICIFMTYYQSLLPDMVGQRSIGLMMTIFNLAAESGWNLQQGWSALLHNHTFITQALSVMAATWHIMTSTTRWNVKPTWITQTESASTQVHRRSAVGAKLTEPNWLFFMWWRLRKFMDVITTYSNVLKWIEIYWTDKNTFHSLYTNVLEFMSVKTLVNEISWLTVPCWLITSPELIPWCWWLHKQSSNELKC